jgi:hypothetical protein
MNPALRSRGRANWPGPGGSIRIRPAQDTKAMRFRQLLLTLILSAFAVPAGALTFRWNSLIYWFSFVYIEVGASDSVTTVNFAVPAGQAGNGVAVVGTPPVLFRVIGRRSLLGSSNYVVTIDSSAALRNQGGVPLPLSNFSWTSAQGEFAAGQFNGTANQQLFRYTGSYLGFEDMLTFRYRNTTVYPSGTYTGRVHFTIAQL